MAKTKVMRHGTVDPSRPLLAWCRYCGQWVARERVNECANRRKPKQAQKGQP